jgi:hypothetical protein
MTLDSMDNADVMKFSLQLLGLLLLTLPTGKRAGC